MRVILEIDVDGKGYVCVRDKDWLIKFFESIFKYASRLERWNIVCSVVWHGDYWAYHLNLTDWDVGIFIQYRVIAKDEIINELDERFGAQIIIV